VAALSFLLGFLLKKVGSVVQIVLGWSVTALFGRLSASKQILLTVALVLSVVWPLLIPIVLATSIVRCIERRS
jgi:hypothetical protein